MSRLLTDTQRGFCVRKKIHINQIYMFPKFGFTVYEVPNYGHPIDIQTNPFTKSLAHEMFLVKEIVDDRFVKGNIYQRPLRQDFYLLKSELEQRPILIVLFLLLILTIPFILYNAATNPKK